MRVSLIILGLCTFSNVLKLHAQVPKLALFYENASWQNPALLAGNEGVEVGIFDHLQNAGTGGLVNTLLLYGEKRKTNQGYGVNYFGDYVGLSQQHALQGSYAHTLVTTSELGALAIGGTLGGYVFRNTDAILNQNTEHLLGVVGIAYTFGEFTMAYHIGRRAEVDIANVNGLFIKYKFRVTDELYLSPILNLNTVGEKRRYQMGLIASAYGLVDIGLVYNTVNTGTDLNFGFNLFKNYRIGYSVVGLGGSVFTQYSQEFFLAWQPSSAISEG